MKSKKITSIILNILIVIVVIAIIIALYNIFQTTIQGRKYANFFGYTIFQVSTGSMSPEFEVDDILIVNILSEEAKEYLEVNDIIVFEQDDSIITHRIVEITEDEIVTRGDANNTEDRPIEHEDVIGKVINVIPRVGIWKKVITTPQVYISLIITAILWGVTLAINTEEKKESNEKE